MTQHNVIAIDGLVATGKGTTAKGVAKALHYYYLDTGALYRVATLYAVRHDLLNASDQEIAAILDKTTIEFCHNSSTNNDDCRMNGENIEKEIRKTELTMKIKAITICRPLRVKIIDLLHTMSKGKNIVLDGRDVGTHIFPQAQLKVFLICDLELRVQRRYEQLNKAGLSTDIEKVRRDIQRRDEHDYLGPNAVNAKSPDARLLDTSNCTIEEQINTIVQRAKEIIS